jgi:hypothetical protein
MGLYFAHGRWYNQETGLWLSPNEKGDYLYGGDGQDPVNVAGSLGIGRMEPSAQAAGCEGKWPPPVGVSSACFQGFTESYFSGYEIERF